MIRLSTPILLTVFYSIWIHLAPAIASAQEDEPDEPGSDAGVDLPYTLDELLDAVSEVPLDDEFRSELETSLSTAFSNQSAEAAKSLMFLANTAVRKTPLGSHEDCALMLLETCMTLLDDHSEELGYRSFARFAYGDSLIVFGQFDEATRILEELVELELEQPSANSRRYEPWAHLMFAEVHINLYQWESVKSHLDQALSLSDSKALGARRAEFLCQAHCDMARYYFEIGVVDQAERQIWEATKSYKPEEQHETTRFRYERMSVALSLAQADPEAALALIEKYLGESGDVLGRHESYLLLDRATAERDLFVEDPSDRTPLDRARAALDRVFELDAIPDIEKIRAHISYARAELRDGRLDAAREQIEMAKDLTRRLRSAGSEVSPLRTSLLHAVEAWYALEADESRPRLLEIQKSLSAAVADLFSQWRSLSLRPGGAGFLHFVENGLVMSQWVELATRLDGSDKGLETALELLLEAQSLGSISRRITKNHIDAPSWKAIRKTLIPINHGILWFLPTTRGCYCFMIDDASVKMEVIRNSSKPYLERVVKDLVVAMLDEEPELPALAEQLAASLIPDSFRRYVDSWEGLTVVGLDLIGWVPVDLLPLTTSSDPVGFVLPVTTLPSLSLGVVLHQRVEEEGDDQVESVNAIVAAESTNESVSSEMMLLDDDQRIERSLIVTEAHLERLRGAPGDRLNEFVFSENATWELFKQYRLNECRLLCFFGHGVIREDQERSAGLLFSDRYVSCEDIESLERMAQVVILSSCQTMSGPQRSGDEGASHLGGALFVSGASVIIQSCLPVELNHMVELSSAVVRYLAQGGLSASESLWRARLDLRERFPDLMTRAFVQVVGNGSVSFFEPTMKVASRSEAKSLAERSSSMGRESRGTSSNRLIILISAGSLALLVAIVAWSWRNRWS